MLAFLYRVLRFETPVVTPVARLSGLVHKWVSFEWHDFVTSLLDSAAYFTFDSIDLFVKEIIFHLTNQALKFSWITCKILFLRFICLYLIFWLFFRKKLIFQYNKIISFFRLKAKFDWFIFQDFEKKIGKFRKKNDF